ncbi:MAG: hypothetical protein K2K42_02640, partial [Eubacterium sp.]|nr:hypothetical protein [Eubacterium sp.]
MKRILFSILCICVIFILSAGVIYVINKDNKNEAVDSNEVYSDTVPQDESSSSINLKTINHCVINDNPDMQYSDEEILFYNAAMEAVLQYQQYMKISSDMKESIWLLDNNPYIKVLADYEIADNEKAIKFKYNYSAEEHKQIVEYLDNAFLNIINTTITKNMTELEKILAIYHYFCTRISYDEEWGNQHYNVFSNEELNIYDG